MIEALRGLIEQMRKSPHSTMTQKTYEELQEILDDAQKKRDSEAANRRDGRHKAS